MLSKGRQHLNKRTSSRLHTEPFVEPRWDEETPSLRCFCQKSSLVVVASVKIVWEGGGRRDVVTFIAWQNDRGQQSQQLGLMGFVPT